MRNGPRRTPGRFWAVVYAVLVHAAVIAALIFGFRWTQAPPAAVPGKPLEAVIAEDPQKQKLEEQKRREEEARKKAETERKRQEAEAQKKQEEEQRRSEAERQKADTEKQRQAEVKRKQEEEARRKQEEEARKQAEAERKRQDAEAQRKREEAEHRRKAAEEQLKQQLAAEEQTRVEAARAARAQSEAEKYRALIKQKVSRHWNRPPGTSSGLRCTVRVRLVPGGDVLEARVVQSSGNPVFDRSVEAAVFKASPLPIPPDADLFEYFREIDFLFNPEG